MGHKDTEFPLPTSLQGKEAAQDSTLIEQRKNQHIDICLEEQVQSDQLTTGFERLRFVHQALPEINFKDIELQTQFFGIPLQAPVLISSMTGGTERALEINKNLAKIAQKHGWALAVGSMRAAVEHPELAASFQVRDLAPDIPIIANIGAVQLNYGFGYQECIQAIQLLDADALVLHLNSLQEVFQPEGNTNFYGLLHKIKGLCDQLPCPVGIKEVGWGISANIAGQLLEAGVSFIDVAGAGGTSWSQVEKHRTADPVLRAAAEAFADWGIPTTECIRDIRMEHPNTPLIASGGIRNGVDVAKALALGADLVGVGRSLLQAAVTSSEQLDLFAQQLSLELRTAMFGIGSANIQQLKETPHLIQI